MLTLLCGKKYGVLLSFQRLLGLSVKVLRVVRCLQGSLYQQSPAGALCQNLWGPVLHWILQDMDLCWSSASKAAACGKPMQDQISNDDSKEFRIEQAQNDHRGVLEMKHYRLTAAPFLASLFYSWRGGRKGWIGRCCSQFDMSIAGGVRTR